MSKEKNTEAAKPAEVSSPASAEPLYEISAIRERCVELLGITTSTFDGALGKRSGKMSVKEAKQIVEAWKKEEVKS